MVSMNPQHFSGTRQDRITPAQAALLKRKGIGARVSGGRDEHRIEDWLADLGIEVADVEELTRDQFARALRELEEEYGV